MLKGIRVLVVEDNVLNQKIVGFILHKEQAVITAALNGLEAITELEKAEFDVVLMDLQMPHMDGNATTLYIRNTLKSNIPIIALTADAFNDDAEEYLKNGMNSFIQKPIEPTELCRSILSVINDHNTTV